MKTHKFVARSLKGSPLAAWLKKKHYKLVSGVVTVKAIPTRGTLKARALKLAAAQIGIKESPANSNNVKFNTWYYGRPVSGLNFAWCAVFVSWVLSHVGRVFKYASVPAILADAKARKNGLSVIAWSNVRAALAAGHLVLACYDWPGESRGVPDHVGFVKQVFDSANFMAIEGNTSPSTAGSQSNGGEVCLKQRHVDDVEAFVLVAG